MIKIHPSACSTLQKTCTKIICTVVLEINSLWCHKEHWFQFVSLLSPLYGVLVVLSLSNMGGLTKHPMMKSGAATRGLHMLFMVDQQVILDNQSFEALSLGCRIKIKWVQFNLVRTLSKAQSVAGTFRRTTIQRHLTMSSLYKKDVVFKRLPLSFLYLESKEEQEVE